MNVVDVAVVGGGVAGLAAARRVAADGRSVAVLEAKPRVGGRAFTDAALGFPFDRGAQWLHCLDDNPLRAVAVEAGFECVVADGEELTHLGDRWATPEEHAARAMAFSHAYETVWAAGRAGRDVTVRELLPGGPWSAAFEQWLADDDGSEPDDLSAVDFARYVETNRHGLLPAGLGAMVATLAEGLRVELSTPVLAVDWRGHEAALDTPRGVLRARKVIVAVPTPLLGALRFTPALPDWKLAAAADLPLGNRDKVALVFDRDRLGLPPGTFVHALGDAPRGLGLEVRPHGRDVVVGHLGARLADALEAEGERAMIDWTLGQVARVFGADAVRGVTAAGATAWRADPDVRGAYSHARPGRAAAREALALPLEDRLFFAGEACSVTAYGTVNGAWTTGVIAAEAALRALNGVGG